MFFWKTLTSRAAMRRSGEIVKSILRMAVLGSHPGIVTGVQFQPDGRSLLSVDNSELKIWRAETD